MVGVLDLEGCVAPHDVGLADCRFEAAPVLRAASINTLLLDGLILAGLIADWLEARGGMLLADAWPGTVLDAVGAVIERSAAIALNGVATAGAFIMRDTIAIKGAPSLNGATRSAIVDNPQSGSGLDDLLLNRCIYDEFFSPRRSMAAPASAGCRGRIRGAGAGISGRSVMSMWPPHCWRPARTRGACRIAKERLQRRAPRPRTLGRLAAGAVAEGLASGDHPSATGASRCWRSSGLAVLDLHRLAVRDHQG